MVAIRLESLGQTDLECQRDSVFLIGQTKGAIEGPRSGETVVQ